MAMKPVAFLFKQRCNTCHYSTMSTTGGAGAGLVDAASYGPPLSRTNVEGEDRERAVRRLIFEGSATMPAFRYALRPEQVDSIGMGYLGAGKVAKLEFRSREELQRLKAETRP